VSTNQLQHAEAVTILRAKLGTVLFHSPDGFLGCLKLNEGLKEEES
jgi:hypothetical protein